MNVARAPERCGRRLALVLLAGLSWACPSERIVEPVTLGGVEIAAETLERGRHVYRRWCARCHAMDGRGRTTAMRRGVPPRDLRDGLYKFTAVPDGLPTDDDLLRVIERGLGERMPAFDHLDAADREAAMQYVKLLAPAWREDEAGTPVALPPDPWGSDGAAAITRGGEVFHVVARCWTCHPTDRKRAALAEALRTADPSSPAVIRADLHEPRVVETEYGPLPAPDLTSDELVAGDAPVDLARTIAAGIAGTGMPAWVDSLSPRDLWALVRYLRARRGAPEASP